MSTVEGISDASAHGAHRRPGVLAIVLAVIAAQALMLVTFAWPASRLAPQDVPLVVAGPPQAADAVADRLAAAEPGAFDVSLLASRDQAEAALRNREAYGAIVLAPDGPTMLVASAASPAVAQLLTQAAQGLTADSGPTGGPVSPITVDDVVPADPDDPRQAALAAGILPLVVTSVLGGALLVLFVGGAGQRLAGLVALAVVGGLAATGILHFALGALAGSYWAESAVVGLTVLAVGAAIAGLGALLGRVGVALGALLMILLGNPLSGVAAAPELLPQPWGVVGQLLPPGAGGSLLRSVTFFDGAASGGPVLVLTAWVVVGLALIGVGALRRRSRTTPAQPTAAQPTAAQPTASQPIPSRDHEGSQVR